ncbi:MAG: hypothetical protein QGH40_14200 [bacterium]|nr:hypothetical protein [bacterium]
MKREIPLTITFIVGIAMIISFFVPHKPFGMLQDEFQNWFIIIASFSIILGMGSLLKVNGEKISRQAPGWGYNVLLVAGLFVTAIMGIIYGVDSTYTETITITPATRAEMIEAVVFVEDGRWDEAETRLEKILKTKDHEVYKKMVSDLKDQANTIDTAQNALVVSDMEQLKSCLTSLLFEPSEQDISNLMGQDSINFEQLTMAFPIKYSNPFFFIFKHIFEPLSSTMFALLAFFIASAAFRAFRAKSFEASLLLVAAIIVMLGRVPIGRSISPYLPRLAEWIMNFLNTAGQRAIMIGAALGVIAASMKIIIGVDRAYLGGGD